VKRIALFALLVIAACGKDPIGPPVFVDPPAAVRVINLSGQAFSAWTIIVGPDADHSGVAYQGESSPTGAALCLETAQVHAERLFIEAAVVPRSSLDTFLNAVSSKTQAQFAAWADSLARGLLTPAVLLASHPGLLQRTAPFDPAPVGFAFPPDTVPWRWTVNPSNTTIVVDTPNPPCSRRA